MSDMFPTPPRSTNYSEAFEKCWKVHAVGNKKAAWKAGEKAGFTEANWIWLRDYLERRHKDDAKWIEGKYVPHMSSIINGERWDDPYKKVSRKRAEWSDAEFQESHEEAERKIAAAQAQRERDSNRVRMTH